MIKIFTFIVTPFQQNCRVLFDTSSHELIIVDPGGDIESIISFLSDYTHDDINQNTNGSALLSVISVSDKVIKILLTHSHIDHGGGVADLVNILENKLSLRTNLLFNQDNDLYRNTIESLASMYGLPVSEFKNVPEASEYIEDNQIIAFGDYKIKALFTPGHAPGHISFYIENAEADEYIIHNGIISENNSFSAPILFAGDTLFDGSIGRTDLPGGNHEELINSINEKLLTLPDSTIVLPGHGPFTTIKKEKNSNPFLV